jgi:hypothetical protein
MVQGEACMAHGARFRVKIRVGKVRGAVCKMQALRYRIEGSGFRIQGTVLKAHEELDNLIIT